MKQKMVIRVSTNRQKPLLSYFNCFGGHNNVQSSLQIAAGFAGVDKVAYVGNGKDKIEVAGDGVDAVNLAIKLRKKVGFALIESHVTEEKGGSNDKKKKEDDMKETSGANEAVLALPPPPVWSYGPHHPYTICNCYQ